MLLLLHPPALQQKQLPLPLPLPHTWLGDCARSPGPSSCPPGRRTFSCRNWGICRRSPPPMILRWEPSRSTGAPGRFCIAFLVRWLEEKEQQLKRECHESQCCYNNNTNNNTNTNTPTRTVLRALQRSSFRNPLLLRHHPFRHKHFLVIDHSHLLSTHSKPTIRFRKSSHRNIIHSIQAT